jgi:hypothetical protein
MERFGLKKLNELEEVEQHRVEVSSRFATLKDLDAESNVESAWETVRENIKMSTKESQGYYELKKHKPCFDEGCSKSLDERKHAKLQWLQFPSKINGDTPNDVLVKREVDCSVTQLYPQTQTRTNIM